MAKKKTKTSLRLFKAVKEQTAQENSIKVIEEMEEIRMHKWLNLIFTVNAAYAASSESYSVFIDDKRLGSLLPNQAKNILVHLKRITKDVDKKMLELLNTMDREVIRSSERANGFFEMLSQEKDLEKAWKNTEIQTEFQENLIRNFSPGSIQNYMEAMNKEVKESFPVLVRNDMQVFFIKVKNKTNYIPCNIVQVEAIARKNEIEKVLVINDDTGKTIQVTKKYLKEIYNGVKGYGDEFVEQFFANIK